MLSVFDKIYIYIYILGTGKNDEKMKNVIDLNSTARLICSTTDWIFVSFELNFQDLSNRQ